MWGLRKYSPVKKKCARPSPDWRIARICPSGFSRSNRKRLYPKTSTPGQPGTHRNGGDKSRLITSDQYTLIYSGFYRYIIGARVYQSSAYPSVCGRRTPTIRTHTRKPLLSLLDLRRQHRGAHQSCCTADKLSSLTRRVDESLQFCQAERARAYVRVTTIGTI